MEDQNYENISHPDIDGFPIGLKEAVFGPVSLILGLLTANCLLFGGANLGFALAMLGNLAVAAGYLRWSGHKGNWYSRVLLILSALIIPGFVRSDDGFVKFVLLGFLFVSLNLGLVTMAGRNLWNPAGVRSLLDPFRGLFGLGFGKLGASFRGVRRSFTDGSPAARNTGAVILGLAIAVPVLAVMIPLLMKADAAFEGLLDLLPEFNGNEVLTTVVFGGFWGCVLFTRGLALNHCVSGGMAPASDKKGVNPLTVNTALFSVCALYVVYLLSQLAYFVGGFSGILPEGYSLAQYARRGFFEMAWLCAINLLVMILGISLARKREGKRPLSTRLACLFLGLVTLFFVAASGAKMVMYIGAYGMTRLRVLTMVIVAFLGLTTAVVSLWLFLPRLPYMQVVMITALLMGGAVLWTDVDTLVAGYNVEAYLSGSLETVDVYYLSGLGSGAVPQIARLASDAPDQEIRESAALVLEGRWVGAEDLRGWNYTDHTAREYLPGEPEDMTYDGDLPGEE